MSEQPGRSGAVERGLETIDGGAYEEELARRVAFRTESQRADSGPDLHRYLDEELRPAFEAMGFECRKYENPNPAGGPLFLAKRMEDDVPHEVKKRRLSEIINLQQSHPIVFFAMENIFGNIQVSAEN